MTAPHDVRKAVIPAAGLGTRFLPATKAVPKEMLPIVDVPTIQMVIEEALDAGIGRVVVDNFDELALLDRLARDRGRRQAALLRLPLDRLGDGTPVGSAAVRAFIEKRQPPVTLHGHIHESPGVERLGRTTSANPGDSMTRLRAIRVDLKNLSVTLLR
jgi:dTDP-glucose pyrophosphorylase